VLRSLLEAAVAKAKLRGQGTVSLPDAPVPPLRAEDMAHDPAHDYALAERSGACEWLTCWIRRAVHAEAFARALNTELEKLRETASGKPGDS